MNLPHKVTIVEVGPRDGFQNEHVFIPTDQKVRIIDALSETGLSRIEATSFVHPKAVPQLADAAEVMTRIKRNPSILYEALIPNLKGAERALQAGVKNVELTISASEAHNKSNVNMSVADSLKNLEEVAKLARANGMRIRGGVGMAFGCPWEGKVPIAKIQMIVNKYLDMGAEEIVLGDTSGMGDPQYVSEVVSRFSDIAKQAKIGLHFHNTRGTGMANVLAGMLGGVTVFDASVCGLGGCPFSPGATGNITTEDLVHMLESMGVSTGVDLPKLIEVAKMVQEVIGRPLPSQMVKAGPVPWALRK
jgi:hydroxymethylglutaryl-CoA lyase